MEWLFSLGSIVLGWFLNEIAKKFQIGRERRAHIGRALSNLLELHHQIRAIENAVELFSNRLSLPDDTMQTLRTFIAPVVQQDDRFISQYEEAIEQLSESDPVTAFELRTQGQLSKLLNIIRSVGTAQGATADEIAFAENSLKNAVLPSLEKGLLTLAQLHGKQTKIRVERLINSPFEPSQEAEGFLQEFQKKIESQSLGLPPTP